MAATILMLHKGGNGDGPPVDLTVLTREARAKLEALAAALPDDDCLKTGVEAIAMALGWRLDGLGA